MVFKTDSKWSVEAHAVKFDSRLVIKSPPHRNFADDEHQQSSQYCLSQESISLKVRQIISVVVMQVGKISFSCQLE